MTATKLLILASLRELGSAHGYQIRRDLQHRGVDVWANIQQGSIYHALGKLHRDGLVREAPTTKGPSRGPARTEYAITAAGRTAFVEYLEQALSSYGGDISETIAGVGLMTELPRRRVIELLSQRVDGLTTWRSQVVDVYEASDEDWLHHVEAIRLWARTADSAIDWTTDLIHRLEQGDYVMAGEEAEEADRGERTDDR